MAGESGKVQSQCLFQIEKYSDTNRKCSGIIHRLDHAYFQEEIQVQQKGSFYRKHFEKVYSTD